MLMSYYQYIYLSDIPKVLGFPCSEGQGNQGRVMADNSGLGPKTSASTNIGSSDCD